MLNAVQKPREVKTGSGKSTGNISESYSGAVRGQEPNRSGLRCGGAEMVPAKIYSICETFTC